MQKFVDLLIGKINKSNYRNYVLNFDEKYQDFHRFFIEKRSCSTRNKRNLLMLT
jgi:hypothetical protein